MKIQLVTILPKSIDCYATFLKAFAHDEDNDKSYDITCIIFFEEMKEKDKIVNKGD